MFVWLLRVYKPTMDGILLLAFSGLNRDQKLYSAFAHTQPLLHALLLASTWVAGVLPHPKDHEGGTGSLFISSGDPNHTSWVSRCPVPGYKPQATLLRCRNRAGAASSSSLPEYSQSVIKPPWGNLYRRCPPAQNAPVTAGTETSQTFIAKDPQEI